MKITNKTFFRALFLGLIEIVTDTKKLEYKRIKLEKDELRISFKILYKQKYSCVVMLNQNGEVDTLKELIKTLCQRYGLTVPNMENIEALKPQLLKRAKVI